jgi:hypothetical protein
MVICTRCLYYCLRNFTNRRLLSWSVVSEMQCVTIGLCCFSVVSPPPHLKRERERERERALERERERALSICGILSKLLVWYIFNMFNPLHDRKDNVFTSRSFRCSLLLNKRIFFYGQIENFLKIISQKFIFPRCIKMRICHVTD